MKTNTRTMPNLPGKPADILSRRGVWEYPGTDHSFSAGLYHANRGLSPFTLGNGTTLLLISNSLALLEALPELAPPAPWRVFPNIDADGLGSLQGSLECWWRSYWWPYWLSLDHQQRERWLNEPTYPQGWREYLRLQNTLNGNGTEPSV
ncbi:hypothetical protein [Pseudomonas sp. MBLB4136]|uniref:hypothetical protein n=1 Tax=Pseudomonas sp. MBLB4136 TaxID=3451558 RepID=UPI003F74EA45